MYKRQVPTDEAILVAYRTEDGVITSADDVLPLTGCRDGIVAYRDWGLKASFQDTFDYEILCGDVISYNFQDKQLDITVESSSVGNENADDTFYLGNFIAGYDTTTDQELDVYKRQTSPSSRSLASIKPSPTR